MGERRAYTFICDDCGQSTTRQWHNGKPHVCIDCGIARLGNVNRQIAAKSGPYYEKWLASKGVAGRPRRHPNGE